MVRMMAWDTEPLPVPGGQDEYQAGLLGPQETAPSSPWRDPQRVHEFNQTGLPWGITY